MPGHLALLCVFQHMSLKERTRAATVCKVSLCALHESIRECAEMRKPLMADMCECWHLQEWHRILQHPSLWVELDLSNWQTGVDSAIKALQNTPTAKEALKKINLEFTVGIEDRHLDVLSQYPLSEANLNGCQKCAIIYL